MEPEELKAILAKDDLVCDSEQDVLALVCSYLKKRLTK